MQKDKKAIKGVSIRKSIVTRISKANMIVLLTACLLILLGTLGVNIWYHYQKDVRTMDIYISNTMSSIDNFLKDMGRVSLVCFSDKRTQQIMRENKNASYREQLENEKYLQELYTSLITIRNDITSVYMFDTENLIYSQDYYITSSKRSDGDIQAFLENVIQNEQQNGNISGCRLYIADLPEFMRYNPEYYKNPYRRQCLYLVRPIRSFSPLELIGHIVLISPVEKIKNLMDKYLETGVSYILLSDNGEIVCSQEEEALGKEFLKEEADLSKDMTKKNGNFVGSYKGQKCLISYHTSDYSGMRLITTKPIRSIVSECKILVLYCCAITFLCSLVALAAGYMVTRKGLRRMVDFADYMSTFEPTNLSEKLEIETEDEIGQLKESFNDMLDIINNLVLSEYKGEIRLQEAKLQEQELSMRYLKSQINPHFLYNTLDMIRIKAALNDDKEVSSMLMQLVTFYRLSTRVDSSLVSIDCEARMIDAYMKLMCCRYPELTYETEIDQELLEVQIPNFMLQPLVENSLLHGLRNRGYKGKVQLKIQSVEGTSDLQIQIIDDGVGMPETLIRQMMENQDQKNGGQPFSDLERVHVGIVNVQTRLRFYYGDDCKITFQNQAEGGLCVFIRLKRTAKKGDILTENKRG